MVDLIRPPSLFLLSEDGFFPPLQRSTSLLLGYSFHPSFVAAYLLRDLPYFSAVDSRDHFLSPSPPPLKRVGSGFLSPEDTYPLPFSPRVKSSVINRPFFSPSFTPGKISYNGAPSFLPPSILEVPGRGSSPYVYSSGRKDEPLLSLSPGIYQLIERTGDLFSSRSFLFRVPRSKEMERAALPPLSLLPSFLRDTKGSAAMSPPPPLLPIKISAVRPAPPPLFLILCLERLRSVGAASFLFFSFPLLPSSSHRRRDSGLFSPLPPFTGGPLPSAVDLFFFSSLRPD